MCRKRRDSVTDILRQGHSKSVVSSVAYEPPILGNKYPPEDLSCVANVEALNRGEGWGRSACRLSAKIFELCRLSVNLS